MALDVADYGYVMEVGRVVMEDTAERLANATDIQEFYLGMKGRGRAGTPTLEGAQDMAVTTGVTTGVTTSAGDDATRVDGCGTIAELFWKRATERCGQGRHPRKGFRHLERIHLGRLRRPRAAGGARAQGPGA